MNLTECCTNNPDGSVGVGDIRDAEAFVRACIAKARGLMLTRQEREELVAEGLVLLLDLARRYDPEREKDASRASFAGYATHLLPRKLSDAWHRMNPHHVLRTQKDGSRRYEYLVPAGAMPEGDGDWRALGDFVR